MSSMRTITRNYSELSEMQTLEERFSYLELSSVVGEASFGRERHLNQAFYKSREWRDIRHHVIARDLGFDLGDPETPVVGNVYIHHMNPLTQDDILNGTDNLLDPEFLISTSLRVHNAIHFGNQSQIPRGPTVRRPGDTKLW